VEIEKYFALVVFNFLFSNGDAHLKNFSLLETPNGDYILAPAYDLINTRLHVDDTDFALKKGLFADDFQSAKYRRRLHPSQEDFVELAKRIGVQEKRIEKLLTPFLAKQDMVESLAGRSFLQATSKKAYLENYRQRRNYLVR
jgi:serine/threonine-protein kinase HipA